MIVTSTQPYSPADYLELEEIASVRREYRNGEIIEMTGGTPNHNELIRALTVILSLSLAGKPYRLFLADQRLWVPQANLYTYPDILVLPTPIELQEGRKDTVLNPVFIAEVLSDSTRNYDRSEKFAAYRTIPGFKEYLLVEQSNMYVEQHLKQNSNQWLMTEYQDPEQSVILESLGVELKLKELYQNLDFSS
ncbi:Uma2 family endonuclease [Phormidium yuhuli AB48]|uniref:Uma2 family endonuclease n=1 Tax=Phormidium yuhuli AB48 TaxID=2940671 RepID=A0ABY5AS28_9CYAN|nr:Uma2 family endonuclease [Phormidium yuhuli]USR91029.1 Uma2 family endonuclease [Phormidium yuhuli AB48]